MPACLPGERQPRARLNLHHRGHHRRGSHNRASWEERRPSALVPSQRQRPVGKGPLHLAQGQFKHRGAVAGQGPAAHPAAVAVLVDADHLEELGNGFGRIHGLADPDDSRRELDAVALVKVHGHAARRVNDDFLIISTAHGGLQPLRGGLRTRDGQGAAAGLRPGQASRGAVEGS